MTTKSSQKPYLTKLLNSITIDKGRIIMSTNPRKAVFFISGHRGFHRLFTGGLSLFGGIVNWYKELWIRIGKRPWTFIARDLYHKFEYGVLVSLFVSGFALGWSGLVSWKWLLVIMGAYTIGFIHGHFFWGTKYIPGQKGE